MTTMKVITLALLSGFFSLASQAAQQANEIPGVYNETGVISAFGSSTLLPLEEQLGAKGVAAETTSFRTASISGNNALHGIANRYN
ncbi:hypothetical protein [[Erwinia] mediterraneensis]|uniref:hypothetical protein n=1 Tax=[Erwinia] mediterraneensis TaxID=2161819 RepID=UPI0010324866|nr:hypothetical protein [[Erwinia] mediterraneensis]